MVLYAHTAGRPRKELFEPAHQFLASTDQYSTKDQRRHPKHQRRRRLIVPDRLRNEAIARFNDLPSTNVLWNW